MKIGAVAVSTRDVTEREIRGLYAKQAAIKNTVSDEFR